MENLNKYRPNYNVNPIKKKDINKIYGKEEFNNIYNKFKNCSKKEQNDFLSFMRHQNLKKYPKNKKCKYGNINKGFSEKEFLKFLSYETHYKAKLIWELQYYLGFRISEIPKLNINNINWDKLSWRVWTSKARQWDEVFINNNIELTLKKYIFTYQDRIKKNKGFLFFSDNVTEKRLVLSEKWIPKQFRLTRTISKLDKTYSMTEESVKGRKSRPQYILTTHSLRHSAITNFYNKCQDIVLTKQFARHKDLKSTLVYIHKDLKEIQFAYEHGRYDKYDSKIKREIQIVLQELSFIKKQEVEKENLLRGENLNHFLPNNTLLEFI